MKKVMCMVLAVLLVLSLVGCGKGVQRLGEDGRYYMGSKEGEEAIKADPNLLDPAKIFAGLTYNEAMLHGNYELAYMEDNLEDFAKSVSYAELQYSNTSIWNLMDENLVTERMSTLPVQVELGHGNNKWARRFRGEHQWASLYLLNERGYPIEVACSYTVSGNTISFFPLDGFEEVVDENYRTEKIYYKVGTDSLDYSFTLSGINLTLTKEGESVTLTSRYFANNGLTGIDIGGYAAEGSAMFEGVDYFYGSLDKDYEIVHIVKQTEEIFSSNYDNACIYMSEDGQISFYWESEAEDGTVEKHLKHLVYGAVGNGTIVMADAENIYYYTENYFSRETAALGEGMTEEEVAQLNGMEETQIEQIVQKKADLLADLAAAYEAAGLNVSINTQTGEIALDSTVLFGTDEATISAEGESFLQQFTQIYTSLVYSEKYADFVSRILVEGHTDTQGSYEHNLELSQQRADNVKAYCLSAECGVDSAYAEQFAQSVEAVGYSYDKPVYNTDGTVNMDASRRVAFRFVINLNQTESAD